MAPEDPAAVVTVDGVNVGPAASVAVPAPARAPAEPVPPVIAVSTRATGVILPSQLTNAVVILRIPTAVKTQSRKVTS